MKPDEMEVHALFAPTIVWPGYEDDFKGHKMQVLQARLEKMARGDLSERATDLEVALYCSSASMIAPPDKVQHDVALYAFGKAYGEKRAKAVLGEAAIEKLDPEAQKLYDGLAEWIFEQQEKHIKGKRLKA